MRTGRCRIPTPRRWPRRPSAGSVARPGWCRCCTTAKRSCRWGARRARCRRRSGERYACATAAVASRAARTRATSMRTTCVTGPTAARPSCPTWWSSAAHHHRLLHEGGYGLRVTDDGALVFTRPEADAAPSCRDRCPRATRWWCSPRTIGATASPRRRFAAGGTAIRRTMGPWCGFWTEVTIRTCGPGWQGA